jgi:hypothetical protein
MHKDSAQVKSIGKDTSFQRPTTTPTPDEIFDFWLPDMSEAELKIILYIVRRTFGFKKDADAISLNQICNGITTKDGRVLDRGTGLCRSSAYKAVQSLEAQGLISVERSQTHKGDNATNIYTLRFGSYGRDYSVDGEDTHRGAESTLPIDGESAHGSAKNNPQVGEIPTPQESAQQTAVQQTAVQETAPAPPADGKPEKPGHAAGGGGSDTPPPKAFPQGVILPEAANQAVQHLVAFGVWQRKAKKVVQELGLSLRTVERATEEIKTEIMRGAKIINPPVVLLSRLAEGWPPPEPEAQIWDEMIDGGEYPVQVELPPRESLSSILDRDRRELDVYGWFDDLKAQLKLQMPDEAYTTWLSTAKVNDFTRDNEKVCLIIELANSYAYEWVKHRLHRVIQRTADTMLGYSIEVSYIGPSCS